MCGHDWSGVRGWQMWLHGGDVLFQIGSLPWSFLAVCVRNESG